MNKQTRREFLVGSLGVAAAACGLSSCCKSEHGSLRQGGSGMRFGLVTYQWGKDWDVPTLITNCQTAGVLGVELRTQHAHGVEDSLNAAQRVQVKHRFADSPVELVSLGTNFAFHYTDQAKLKANIEGAKRYVKLSHDIGSTGVKVKPNDLPQDVPVDKTIEQIGTSLNELGRFAGGFGQQIRVEVHGRKTQDPEIMKKIFDVADNPNVTICWNCNDQDLAGKGLEHNFQILSGRFGDTAHVRELNVGNYPYQKLIDLFTQINYKGWILLEARTSPPDRVKAMAEQKAIFEQMVANAKAAY